MFEKLKAKWKVDGFQFFMIMCTFAVTGTLTAYVSRFITSWVGFTDQTFWLWKFLLRLAVLVFGYQVIILVVSFLFGQFRFFWAYEKKIWRWMLRKSKNSQNLIIFASGAGSNAQKIIDFFRNDPAVKISLIVCNKPGAGVLDIAEKEHIPALLIEKEQFFRGNGYVDELKAFKPDLLILAGFLWKLPACLVAAFPHQIINIHPALLPKYGGKGMYGHFVHEAVLASGDQETGITIHYVDELYDHGDYIFQARVPVDQVDTPETIAKKVQVLEHTYFPKVVKELLDKKATA